MASKPCCPFELKAFPSFESKAFPLKCLACKVCFHFPAFCRHYHKDAFREEFIIEGVHNSEERLCEYSIRMDCLYSAGTRNVIKETWFLRSSKSAVLSGGSPLSWLVDFLCESVRISSEVLQCSQFLFLPCWQGRIPTKLSKPTSRNSPRNGFRASCFMSEGRFILDFRWLIEGGS